MLLWLAPLLLHEYFMIDSVKKQLGCKDLWLSNFILIQGKEQSIFPYSVATWHQKLDSPELVPGPVNMEPLVLGCCGLRTGYRDSRGSLVVERIRGECSLFLSLCVFRGKRTTTPCLQHEYDILP